MPRAQGLSGGQPQQQPAAGGRQTAGTPPPPPSGSPQGGPGKMGPPPPPPGEPPGPADKQAVVVVQPSSAGTLRLIPPPLTPVQEAAFESAAVVRILGAGSLDAPSQTFRGVLLTRLATRVHPACLTTPRPYPNNQPVEYEGKIATELVCATTIVNYRSTSFGNPLPVNA